MEVPGFEDSREQWSEGSPALMNVICSGGGAFGSVGRPAPVIRSSTSVPCDRPGHDDRAAGVTERGVEIVRPDSRRLAHIGESNPVTGQKLPG